MPQLPLKRHGGKILVDQLVQLGCDAVFCVAGESFLPVLDGLYDHPQVMTVPCRHESGAAIMAEAYGKMTGRPAVCIVTRGPGATNASLGVHIAFQDSTPMIMLIGQVQREFLDREGFQEVDFKAMYRPLAKWAAQIEDVRRIPEYLSRAWNAATAGRAGPVVLSLPEDVLFDSAQVNSVMAAPIPEPQAPQNSSELVHEFFSGAQSPVVIVGGGGWSEKNHKRITQFAERNNLPVVAEFRCQDYMDNRHPNYIGDLGISTGPKLVEAVKQSDRILCIGARLGELPTQKYSMIESPMPNSRFFHVHPDISELGRVYRPDVSINASSKSFLSQIQALKLKNSSNWLDWTTTARENYLEHSKPVQSKPSVSNDEVIVWLRDNLPPDAIVVSGAGISTGVLHRYYYYGARYRTQLAPIAGSMGYGIPAAISAKICEPDRRVICIVGDGCFLMTAQEMATAAMLELTITVVVVNNGVLGTIRQHQELKFPNRVIATDLLNPDFATYAQSFGAMGLTAKTLNEFIDAFRLTEKHNGLSLIDLQIDRNAYIESILPK